jgi:hypothetical protein
MQVTGIKGLLGFDAKWPLMGGCIRDGDRKDSQVLVCPG